MRYEKIMYEKILSHLNCEIELDKHENWLDADTNEANREFISAVSISNYGDGKNVAIECNKCNEVIIDFDKPSDRSRKCNSL